MPQQKKTRRLCNASNESSRPDQMRMSCNTLQCEVLQYATSSNSPDRKPGAMRMPKVTCMRIPCCFLYPMCACGINACGHFYFTVGTAPRGALIAGCEALTQESGKPRLPMITGKLLILILILILVAKRSRPGRREPTATSVTPPPDLREAPVSAPYFQIPFKGTLRGGRQTRPRSRPAPNRGQRRCLFVSHGAFR